MSGRFEGITLLLFNNSYIVYAGGEELHRGDVGGDSPESIANTFSGFIVDTKMFNGKVAMVVGGPRWMNEGEVSIPKKLGDMHKAQAIETKAKAISKKNSKRHYTIHGHSSDNDLEVTIILTLSEDGTTLIDALNDQKIRPEVIPIGDAVRQISPHKTEMSAVVIGDYAYLQIGSGMETFISRWIRIPKESPSVLGAEINKTVHYYRREFKGDLTSINVLQDNPVENDNFGSLDTVNHTSLHDFFGASFRPAECINWSQQIKLPTEKSARLISTMLSIAFVLVPAIILTSTIVESMAINKVKHRAESDSEISKNIEAFKAELKDLSARVKFDKWANEEFITKYPLALVSHTDKVVPQPFGVNRVTIKNKGDRFEIMYKLDISNASAPQITEAIQIMTKKLKSPPYYMNFNESQIKNIHNQATTLDAQNVSSVNIDSSVIFEGMTK